jgi:putative phosphoribosyl transferase
VHTKFPVQIPIDGEALSGDLGFPDHPHGLILFAHGSGSSRFSSRNRSVARTLEQHQLATLLIDLLTPQEERIDERTGEYRFDIPLLASRLVAIVDWLRQTPQTASLPVGLFGASTGAGAALIAAAERPEDVLAVVSRGGRPDLAGPALPNVAAPTLLIVGGLDTQVIELNRSAMRRMHGEVTLEIVPDASHLFEESGTLDRVAALASDWFTSRLHPLTAEPRP